MFKPVRHHRTLRVHVPRPSRDAMKRGNCSLIIKSAKILDLANIVPKGSSIHNKPLVWCALSWLDTPKTSLRNHQKRTPTSRRQRCHRFHDKDPVPKAVPNKKAPSANLALSNSRRVCELRDIIMQRRTSPTACRQGRVRLRGGVMFLRRPFWRKVVNESALKRMFYHNRCKNSRKAN